jgi:hypothetical protein
MEILAIVFDFLKLNIFWIIFGILILATIVVSIQLFSRLRVFSGKKMVNRQDKEIKKLENISKPAVEPKIIEQNQKIMLKPAMEVSVKKHEANVSNNIMTELEEHKQSSRYPIIHLQELKEIKIPKQIVSYSKKRNIEENKLKEEIASLRKEIRNSERELKEENAKAQTKKKKLTKAKKAGKKK